MLHPWLPTKCRQLQSSELILHKIQGGDACRRCKVLQKILRSPEFQQSGTYTSEISKFLTARFDNGQWKANNYLCLPFKDMKQSPLGVDVYFSIQNMEGWQFWSIKESSLSKHELIQNSTKNGIYESVNDDLRFLKKLYHEKNWLLIEAAMMIWKSLRIHWILEAKSC